MIRKYHDDKLQTNPRHREEELQEIYSNKTSKRQQKQSNNISFLRHDDCKTRKDKVMHTKTKPNTEQNQKSEPPNLYTYEPPSQKSWIHPWYLPLINSHAYVSSKAKDLNFTHIYLTEETMIDPMSLVLIWNVSAHKFEVRDLYQL